MTYATGSCAAGIVAVALPRLSTLYTDSRPQNATIPSGLIRLDRLKIGFDYAPLTTNVMLMAADLWARARHRGTPTAPPDAFDGDMILAAQSLLSAGPGDVLTVATDNVKHLAQFVDARPWESIAG